MPQPSLWSSVRPARGETGEAEHHVGGHVAVHAKELAHGGGRSNASGQPQYGRTRWAWASASFGRAQEKTPHRGVGAEADGALACRARGRDVTLEGCEVRERGPVGLVAVDGLGGKGRERAPDPAPAAAPTAQARLTIAPIVGRIATSAS